MQQTECTLRVFTRELQLCGIDDLQKQVEVCGFHVPEFDFLHTALNEATREQLFEVLRDHGQVLKENRLWCPIGLNVDLPLCWRKTIHPPRSA